MLASEAQMKRIIDGVTYNTDTSTRLAVSEGEALYANEPYPCQSTLYQTRGGAFFIHERIDLGQNENEPREYRDRAKALSPAEAEKWIMSNDVEVFHNPFGEPPEAVAETEPSTTIYVRVPASLKQRLEQAAKSDKLSGNSWAIRCIERCLVPDDELRNQIGRVWHLAKTIEFGGEESRFTDRGLAQMAGEIADIIETNRKKLGFAEGRVEEISDLASSEYWSNLDNKLFETKKDY